MSKVTLNQLAKFLRDKGLDNDYAIAGVGGNIAVESGWSTTAFNESEQAIGLCQWEGGRRTGLQQLAKKRKGKEFEAAIQLEWLWTELTTHEPYKSTVYPSLRNATSAANAATLWDGKFEVSDGSTRDRRVELANEYYAALTKNTPSKPAPKPSKPVEHSGRTYKVQKGDTLSGIASGYRMTWQQLYGANQALIGHDPNHIEPGQVLVIPNTRGEQNTYQVKNGDTLSGIAKAHGLPSWHALYDANRGVIGADPDHIEPGQTLVIP